MAPATLNKLCKEALKDAGVDTQKYTSHAIRGNVECAMIAASHDSKLYKASEGIRRARHTQETHERNYKRPAHPEFIATLRDCKYKEDLTPLKRRFACSVGR